MLSKSSNITVQLLEPNIYIESESESDACNVIRGTVNLNIPKTTTINALSVRFDGKMETKNNTFDIMESSTCSKKPLVRQRLVLYPNIEQPAQRPLVLSAGLTQFGFEMQIPSGLPETIDCSDISVNYHVTAVMEYYTTSTSFIKTSSSRRLVKQIAKQNVRIARLPNSHLLIGDNINPTIDSRTHKSNWLHYQILVDKKAVSIGSELPVTFLLSPAKKGVCVDRISVQVLERRDLYNLDTNIHTRHAVHAIRPVSSSSNIPLRQSLDKKCEGTIDYQIPENKSLVHSTQSYSEFSVSHTLLVSLSLSLENPKNQSRSLKTVTFQTKIDILDAAVNETELLKLPRYDAPPPFDNTEYVFGEYDRKFAEPPAYEDLFA
ncbi:hypothetical protein K501DRAFT_258717 [Backusella circina FSU 941]|nr:hypothetical protein K501DRAFT_258717 [Backusella circina FSU 941]